MVWGGHEGAQGVCVGVSWPGDFWGLEHGEGSEAGSVEAVPGVWAPGLVAHMRHSCTPQLNQKQKGASIFGGGGVWPGRSVDSLLCCTLLFTIGGCVPFTGLGRQLYSSSI